MGISDAYQVIARKWRPKTFKDVTGQRHIVQALQNAIKLDRIPHAYIFSGIRGVGKTSLARIFARSVNCQQGPTMEPCGECESCREITNGSSMDVIEIDGASNNGVDDIREIRDQLQYAPVKSRKKIYIVDEVHMLSKAAFNAFLKTLEEPPPHSLFIFATTELNKIPETVLSRCQCFEFRALTESEIVQRLSEIAGKDGLKADEPALRLIARRADGSMRDAQSLLDQVNAYATDTVDEEMVGMVLGLVSREKIWTILEAIINRQVDEALFEIKDLYYAGYDIASLIRELFEAVRELTVIKVMKNPEKVLEETAESIERMRAVVKNVSAARLQQYYDLLIKADPQSKTAGNSLSVLEMAVIKMVRLDDVVPVDQILKNLASGTPAGRPAQAVYSPPPPSYGKTARHQPAPEPAAQIPQAAEQASPAPFPANGGDWAEIKNALSSKSMTLAGTLAHTGLTVDGNKAVITYPETEKFIRGQIERNRELIEGELEKAFGKKISFILQPVKAGAPQRAEKKTELDDKTRKNMLNNEIIQKAVDIFEGRPSLED